MKTLKYKEIMPRVAIEKLKLIEKKDLLDLVGRNLEAIRCFLLETSYREEIQKIPKEKANSTSMEEALLKNFARTLRNLIRFSEGDIENVMRAVARKFEARNIKTLLRATKNKNNLEETLKYIIPVRNLSEENFQDTLRTCSTIEEVVQSLSKSEYGSVLQEALNTGTRPDDLLQLEFALDKYTYKKIFESIEKLSGLDKRVARSILGMEVDAINVKSILRCKAMGMAHDQIKKYLIPSLFLNEEILEKAIKSPDVKSLAKILLRAAEKSKNVFYQDIFQQILRQYNFSLSQLEILFERASLEVSLNVIRKHFKYYNIGFVLAFLGQKWSEIRNLRSLIVGAERRVSSAEIRRFLII